MASEKALTARDVCLIIKESKEAGLAELQWGDLKIQFWAKVQQIPPPIHVPEAIRERQSTIESEHIADSEVLTREEQLLRLQVEDPVAYEQLMISGDLEKNSRDDDAGDEDGKEANAY